MDENYIFIIFIFLYQVNFRYQTRKTSHLTYHAGQTSSSQNITYRRYLTNRRYVTLVETGEPFGINLHMCIYFTFSS